MRLSRTRDFDPQFILTEALWLIHSFKLIRGEYGEVAKLVTVHFFRRSILELQDYFSLP
jgi:hypothetical protein